MRNFFLQTAPEHVLPLLDKSLREVYMIVCSYSKAHCCEVYSINTYSIVLVHS